MRAMGMSNRSTWCSLTRCRSRSSGPSKGGSPGLAAGSVTRKASAVARAGATSRSSSPAAGPHGAAACCAGAFAMCSRVRPLQLHRGADLLHGGRRRAARLCDPELHQLLEVLGTGQDRLAPRAEALLVGAERLEQLPLAVDAADPRRAAALVDPGHRLGRRVDLVQETDAADVRLARIGPPLAGWIGRHGHDLLGGRLGRLAEDDGVAV